MLTESRLRAYCVTMSEEILKVRGLLEAAQRKLKDVERQALALRAEITAYEKVCAILSGQEHVAGAESARPNGSSRRQRPISETWRKVFSWIGKQLYAPETEDIFKYTETEGLNVNRNTLRSQLSVYTNQGWLERDGAGYRLSAHGRASLSRSPHEASGPAPDDSPGLDIQEKVNPRSIWDDPIPSDSPSTREIDLDDEIPF
jgi:hypothetical protein